MSRTLKPVTHTALVAVKNASLRLHGAVPGARASGKRSSREPTSAATT